MANDDIQPWRTLASEPVFVHPWYHLRRDTVELPDGTVLDDYFVSVRSEIAVTLALTADDEVVMARQYKHGIGEITLELPGGLVDDGEEPRAAAERELREETGYACGPLTPLARLIHDPSKGTNRAHGFLGRDARWVGEQRLDPSEQIQVELIPFDEIDGLLRDGSITGVVSVALLLLALRDRSSKSPNG
jgi:ADP-ribose pyrophosphatase